MVKSKAVEKRLFVSVNSFHAMYVRTLRLKHQVLRNYIYKYAYDYINVILKIKKYEKHFKVKKYFRSM